MVEFLTLFLGLVGGPQLVALDASPEVAAIELRLDGEVVGYREHSPWTFEIDFGSELVPRELEAVAFGAGGREAGRELSRARQLLNLPRPPAEVRLVLSRGDDESEVVRTHWESAVTPSPTSASAFLDGEPLVLLGGTPAEQVAQIPLPSVDRSGTHLLEVELEFGPEVQASAHVIFGLGTGFQTSADLTALPVTGAKRPRPEQMDGWFRLEGPEGRREPLQVVAVEKGQADLVVVRGPGVDVALRQLKGMPQDGLTALTGIGTAALGTTVDTSALGGLRSGPAVAVSGEDEIRTALALPDEARLRLLLTRARSGSGRLLDLDRFSLSPDITPELGGLPRALGETFDETDGDGVRVWDAVALAGLRAAESNRRRAVLLVVTGGWQEQSLYGEAAVRGFLDSIHVPLYVWHLVEVPDASDVVGGQTERIRKFAQLRSAARRLRKDLAEQRIVWFEGVHLPNSIGVVNGAGVEPVTER